mmetsp:Transcript_86025/g.135820  ORF Transcript_86025/g.135820 Transcript_86025/m.135820 type:complete len:224 (-) Transcript_86025:280-951(-)
MRWWSRTGGVRTLTLLLILLIVFTTASSNMRISNIGSIASFRCPLRNWRQLYSWCNFQLGRWSRRWSLRRIMIRSALCVVIVSMRFTLIACFPGFRGLFLLLIVLLRGREGIIPSILRIPIVVILSILRIPIVVSTCRPRIVSLPYIIICIFRTICLPRTGRSIPIGWTTLPSALVSLSILFLNVPRTMVCMWAVLIWILLRPAICFAPSWGLVCTIFSPWTR